jgi:hypothetical protein
LRQFFRLQKSVMHAVLLGRHLTGRGEGHEHFPDNIWSRVGVVLMASLLSRAEAQTQTVVDLALAAQGKTPDPEAIAALDRMGAALRPYVARSRLEEGVTL